ncbi:TIGR01212 family radical SAM protein [Ruminococcus difficilis]|uniref:TIGR01212 family radical SAM protein n=1 Tax=Ruminococcus difficilis TaxID=2763069 RepID=A0A934U366_9FIRM|nr:TIGR01212 family radical SAM protein [Ruminococcus difficilis]MBK6088092.1 TIGR01212 family radical SAM protein [Ruminococcus difficilis]
MNHSPRQHDNPKRYYSLNEYYKRKYGKKVYRLAISGGMTCPNRDGTIGERGCIFCSAGGSGEFASSAGLSVGEQLEEAKHRVRSKTRDNLYIAYFQPFTNTYAPVKKLRALYEAAIASDDIVGLSIGTRPDCLPPEVIELLREINRKKPVTVELGLQTIHESTAAYIRRGYPLSVYDEAVKALHQAGIEVVTHVILGLPGETEEMMLETVKYVGRVTDGVKLQLLHVLEGTDLAADYRRGLFQTLTLEEYARILCRCIRDVPKHVVIYRLTGDGDKKHLIAPQWSADKKRVLNYINKSFADNQVQQGEQ